MTDEGFCYADYVRRRCGVVEKVTRLNEQHRIDTDTVVKISAERDAARAEAEALRLQLQTVTDLIDDVLYDPEFHPVDAAGNELHCDALYLTDHPLRERYMPALRAWFVARITT